MDLPAYAVAKALTRLESEGVIQRIGRGLYHRRRETPFGPSRPSANAILQLLGADKNAQPAGVTAANELGLTTQVPAHADIATTSGSLPRSIIGEKAKVRTHRPHAWSSLSRTEAAILDTLRDGGKSSDQSPEQTVSRLLELLRDQAMYERIIEASTSEPPRVRAILGAFGEDIGHSETLIVRLRASLHPLSRFDFGKLDALKSADRWQSRRKGKERATK